MPELPGVKRFSEHMLCLSQIEFKDSFCAIFLTLRRFAETWEIRRHWVVSNGCIWIPM